MEHLLSFVLGSQDQEGGRGGNLRLGLMTAWCDHICFPVISMKYNFLNGRNVMKIRKVIIFLRILNFIDFHYFKKVEVETVRLNFKLLLHIVTNLIWEKVKKIKGHKQISLIPTLVPCSAGRLCTPQPKLCELYSI